VELAKVEQKRVRAGLMPTVQLRFERQWGTYYGQQPAGERVYVNTQAAFGAGLSALQQQQQALSRTEAAEQQVGATRQRVQSLANRVWHEELAAQSQLDNASELSRAYDDLESSSLRLFTAGRRTWQELMNLQRERHQLFMQQSDAQSALFGARLRMLWLADVFPGVQLTDHPQPPPSVGTGHACAHGFPSPMTARCGAVHDPRKTKQPRLAAKHPLAVSAPVHDGWSPACAHACRN